MTRNHLTLALAAVAAGALGLHALQPEIADAADHAEAPGTVADALADIGDFYAWHTGDSVVAVVTYSPFMAAGADGVYDADLNYEVHIDNDGDLENGPEHTIDVRFGQNGAGAWGVQATGIPGAAGPLVGDVETVIEDGASRVWAGISDDPFFFDQAGLISTVSENNDDGSVDFSGLSGDPVDALEGLNIMSIVIEFDRGAAADGASTIDMWATTGRVPGTGTGG